MMAVDARAAMSANSVDQHWSELMKCYCKKDDGEADNTERQTLVFEPSERLGSSRRTTSMPVGWRFLLPFGFEVFHPSVFRFRIAFGFCLRL